ncbi:glycosyltransferase family 4 protein [Cytobacillus sp. IB215316]|uniref:glycosyltransferase family 4 protein n=1 Tax=Cytobacillus sp. IB215316 TaxID=3097354 RepID=UPI002A0BA347|nr:glycosyltransferase family 4 protein [Cytobacillus sp. IB215316]MDX8362531.1 glycosyltransferase family 4 protein [Cytobacillus sp. IB215316]
MKICFICTEKLPSPSIRGGAIQLMIDGVLPYLKDDHDITVFSITDPDLPDKEERSGVTFIRFDREHYRSLVAEELTNHTFDVIHVYNRPANVPLYKQASPSSRFVVSLHNEMFAEHKLPFDEGQQIVRDVDAITTVSNYIKQTVLTRFPEAEKKIKVVYSGVDLQQFIPLWSSEGKRIRQRLRQKYSIAQHEKVILFVGRLSQSKGPHILLEAMKYILKKNEHAVLVIVGGKWFSDNNMNGYVRSLYKQALPYGDRIIFTKYIPAEHIPHLFLIGDVFVCSSLWNEPLARVHYEAMAAGIPVVTTKRGGNEEVMIDAMNGLLIYDYNNPLEYAKSINFILSHPSIARGFAKLGRKFVEVNFQFHHVADRLERVYNEVLYEEKQNST